ncbi:MAG: hypothetical protein EOP10_15680 [Proteobacteria bacterium]|nr:MAG: hypothetical protein EOP10_15680 [Pseudomonadota bacterium]
MKVFLEILESLGLLVCLLLASPFRFFRRLDHLAQITEYSGFLVEKGLFSDLLRARLDYRMGNYHQSGVLLAPIIRHLERAVQADKERGAPLKLRRLLCTLYCDQQQIYFLCGQMEEAVMTVIRAHSFLGIDRLPSNPDLDLKTAHVVKAGVAASKMLEEGGLATLMVRQGEEPVVSRPPQKQPSRGFKPELNKTKKPSSGIVIPFPLKT